MKFEPIGKNAHLELSPEASASIISKITFSWLNNILLHAYYNPLSLSDLYNLIDDDQSWFINSRFTLFTSTCLQKSLFHLIKPLLIWQSFYALGSALLAFSGPLFLSMILKYVENPNYLSNQNYAFLLVLGMFCTSLLKSCCDGQMYFLGRRMGIRVRSTIITQLYTKSLKRVNQACGGQNNENTNANTGEIINLMSVDSQKLLEVSCYLVYIFSTPLQIIISIGFLISILGLSALAGVSVMCLMVPVGAYLGKQIAKKQKLLMKSTDIRIRSIHELLSGIRLVKFYSWEHMFLTKIDKNRADELLNLWSYIFTIAINKVLWYATPIAVSFLTFASYTLLEGNELTATTAFTGLALFNTLRIPLQTFPDIIVRIGEAMVSLKRIQSFLDELDLDSIKSSQVPIDTTIEKSIGFPSFSDFTYFSNDGSSKFSLHNIKAKLPMNDLTVIVGPTGSGKTSMVLALLGEMKCLSGGSNLKAHFSKISYVSQQVWLVNATIRENILFGHEFDSKKYKNTIQACALSTDLKTLPAGDMTEVGEGGVNLSGGQKARISLARAAYSNTECVILDDPLSAVDAPTARHLFEHCICGIMAGRTRILVTHAVSLCAPMAKHIIVMKAGMIEKQGDSMSVFGKSEANYLFETSGLEKEIEHEKDHDKKLNGTLIKEETRSEGSVSSEVYLLYCYAAGGYWFIFSLLVIFILTQTLLVSNDWWLKTWVSGSRNSIYESFSNIQVQILLNVKTISSALSDVTSKNSTMFYLSIYGSFGLVTVLMIFTKIMVVARGSIKASRHLHHSLLRRILSAPVRFFEVTPIGRILNRFSKDMKDLDQEVATFSSDFLSQCTSAIGTIGLIMFITPLAIVGVIPIAIIYLFIAKKYLRTSRELKRLDAVTRSPIFSNFSEALKGASTIRAYSSEQRFIQENYERIDTNHRAFFFLWASNRWLSLRVDLVGATVTLCSSLAIVFFTRFNYGIDAGVAGLSLSYALVFTEALLWIVRMHALMEMEMNAVERINEYVQIEQEFPSIIEDKRPPADWPSTGNIMVKDLSVGYGENSPAVLKNVSFSVKGGEKLGIVGRTGAGKSSLSLAFFRFVEPRTGYIEIDGVNIYEIGTHDLRTGLTIIPQHPTLFAGTVRSNLDPFQQYLDQDMLVALRRSYLLDMPIKSRQSSTVSDISIDQQATLQPQFRLTLDSSVEEEGSNFSQGQKQLLCLARAILKRSKIIILDEATASVDHETDAKIQKTIRDEFHGCTILCIAHRLRTVMDYDKILLLKNGQVEEFGTPYELITYSSNKTGKSKDKIIKATGSFKGMCDESGEYEDLLKIAKK